MSDATSQKTLKRSYDFVIVGTRNPADALMRVSSIQNKSVLHVSLPQEVDFKVLSAQLCSVSGKIISTTRIFWCADPERKPSIFAMPNKAPVSKKSTLYIATDLSDMHSIVTRALEGVKTSIVTNSPHPFVDFDTSVVEAVTRDLKNKNIRLYTHTEVLSVYKDGEYWVTQAQQDDVPHKFRTEAVVEYTELSPLDDRIVASLDRPYVVSDIVKLLDKKRSSIGTIRWKKLVYTQPIIQVGITEQEAVKKCLPYIKSLETLSTPDGVSWVKILALANRRILGAVVWHPHSPDIAFEIFRAITQRQKAESLLQTIRLDRPGMGLLASALSELS
jgi:hypothetical protein